jgi:signal transduction histidine kinase
MANRTANDVKDRGLPPRIELILVLAALAVSLSIGLGGLAIAGPALLVPLAAVLVVGFFFNFVLLWLDRRGAARALVAWASRLGNLVLLTAGVRLTGGFGSPFFSLYAVYIIAGGLRSGWRGTGRSFALCVASWIFLAALALPAEPGDWAQAAVLVSAFVAVGLAVGVVAQRYAGYWQESQQRAQELALLRDAGRALGASLDPEEVLAATLARANELLDVEAASLALLDEDTGHISFEVAIGGAIDAVEGLRLDPGQGIVGHVIQTGEPLLVPDVAADPRWYAGVDQASGYQTRSLLCVPLRTKGQVVGALEVVNKRDGPFTEGDARLLSSLADLAAQGMENARLHEQIRHSVERLQEAYDEVRRLDELKSAFIRSVSHELRTPLTLMQGYLELLLDGQLGPLRPEQQQGLSVVADKAGHLTHIVSDIISLQTIGAMGFHLEVLCLATLARARVDDLRPAAERAGIRLETDLLCAEDLLYVRGDAQRLEQVLHHLLDNAIKFSPDGGTVRLSLDREEDQVCVRVEDEGIGLPGDQWERIFDRFYQVDGSLTRRYGGTGVGLALVREVVEAHGGGVWVESEGIPGRGSTFTVFLPAYEGRAVA